MFKCYNVYRLQGEGGERMTPKGQRIAIIVIAVVMLVGTLGSFVMYVLANDNAMREQEQAAKELQEMHEQQQKEAKELADKHYPMMHKYEDRPAAFDADAVGDKVTHVDLKEGDGEVITKDSIYRAYYIGWNPKGTVFDTSLQGDTLAAPLTVSPGRLVAGWYDGVDGMKMGGVREITIPSDLAYGESGGHTDDIPPNTPIKFVVMAIPASE